MAAWAVVAVVITAAVAVITAIKMAPDRRVAPRWMVIESSFR
jgi:hypothetical protein